MYKLNKREKGFTLVELMVAAVIGLFGILVMTNFYLGFNKDKGRAINGANALNNAKLAMAVIESDLRNSGYGLTANGSKGCNQAYAKFNGTAIQDFTIDGILIHDSTGFNGSDDIVIQYADGSNGIGGGMLRSAYAPGGTDLYPSQVFGCNVKDVILLSSADKCSLQQISAVDKTAFKITIQPNSEFNPSQASMAGWPTFPIDSYATCIGNYNRVSYKVSSNGALAKKTFPNDWDNIVDNIVVMKAQYGISNNPAVNKVDQWVNATGNWANIDATKRKQIKSVRIGFVMRNTEIEKNDVTQACNPDTGAGLCIWQGTTGNPPPTINIQNPANWKKYKYVTLSTIVPLKNMLWN